MGEIKYKIKKGTFENSNNIEFRLIVDACNAFGKNYKGYRRAYCELSHEEDYALWFPKIIENSKKEQKWKNTYEGEYIIEELIRVESEKIKTIEFNIKRIKRIVFIKKGGTYKFVGIYEIEKEESRRAKKSIYKKVDETLVINDLIG